MKKILLCCKVQAQINVDNDILFVEASTLYEGVAVGSVNVGREICTTNIEKAIEIVFQKQLK